MTEQEMRIATAVEMGWREVAERSHFHPERREQSVHGEHEWWLCGFAPGQNILSEPPNYTQDLNAMHEVEKTLNNTYEYTIELDRLTHRNEWHASAHQRCEAFLRVHGLWKE